MSNSLTVLGTGDISVMGANEPRYKRIEADLRQRIQRGEWAQGVMLPGRRTLAEEYDVDLMTLQRAIARLLDDETLVASGRRGTFVNRAGNGSMAQAYVPAEIEKVQVPTLPAKVLRLAIVGSGVADYSLLEPAGVFFMYTFLRSFEEAVRQEHEADFVFADRHGKTLEETFKNIDLNEFDAVVVLFADGDEDLVTLTKLRLTCNVPILLMASSAVNVPLPVVFYDNFSAGFEVGRYLLQNGVQELTMLAPFSDSWVTDRIAGLAEALKYGGLPESALQIFPVQTPKPMAGMNQREYGHILARELFASGMARQTIVSVNDFTSLGILLAAEEFGLEAGKDFRLISFDDIPQASLGGISSMRPPLEAMGREGARILTGMLAGECEAPQVRLQSRLVVRGSSRFNAATSGDSSR